MDMDMDVDMDMDMDIDVYHRPNLERACNVGCRLFFLFLHSFPSPHPPLIVLTPLLFIYKIIAVMVDIDTS